MRGRSPTYLSWSAMRQRCLDAQYHHFNNYGGRGIKICDRWNDFANFLTDMGERPDGTTLERMDTNGDYTPSNCRWATRVEQQRNRRNALLIEINGVRKHLKEWCAQQGVPYKTARTRLHRGWSAHEALEMTHG